MERDRDNCAAAILLSGVGVSMWEDNFPPAATQVAEAVERWRGGDPGWEWSLWEGVEMGKEDGGEGERGRWDRMAGRFPRW